MWMKKFYSELGYYLQEYHLCKLWAKLSTRSRPKTALQQLLPNFPSSEWPPISSHNCPFSPGTPTTVFLHILTVFSLNTQPRGGENHSLGHKSETRLMGPRRLHWGVWTLVGPGRQEVLQGLSRSGVRQPSSPARAQPSGDWARSLRLVFWREGKARPCLPCRAQNGRPRHVNRLLRCKSLLK